MDCKRFSPTHGWVYCKHFDECHQLKICLCEIDDDNPPPPPPPPKRKHAAKIPWPQRQQQILELAREQGTITTVSLMAHTRGKHGTVSQWIRKLIKEGELVCQTPAITLGPHHQPAVYEAAPRSSYAPPASRAT